MLAPKAWREGEGAREVTWGREPRLGRQSQRQLPAEPLTRAAASGVRVAPDLHPRALPKAAGREPAVPPSTHHHRILTRRPPEPPPCRCPCCCLWHRGHSRDMPPASSSRSDTPPAPAAAVL